DVWGVDPAGHHHGTALCGRGFRTGPTRRPRCRLAVGGRPDRRVDPRV
ncbi:uncharacterized protein METZ01_LOCUS252280, partial [marine metagenome]